MKVSHFASILLRLFLLSSPPFFSQFVLVKRRARFLLLGTVLSSFSSFIYAAEQGEYQHYLGFGISGALLSDDLQAITFADDDISDDLDYDERGGFFVWDIIELDTQDAISIMILAGNESAKKVYSDGSTYDERISFWGTLAAGKYFVSNNLYVGGGLALLSISGYTSLQDTRITLTADTFVAPTSILGYRRLVSEFKESHFYIGVDWIKTLPLDVEYEVNVDYELDSPPTRFNTFKDLSISMIAVSFGWAW